VVLPVPDRLDVGKFSTSDNAQVRVEGGGNLAVVAGYCVVMGLTLPM
jgi:hypothetical protein